MGYVDLHAHFLPGLDDGAADLATGLKILRGLAEVGYERVTATPHQYAHRFMPARDAIDAAWAKVQDAVAGAGLPLTLSLAAENMWDDVFFGRWADGSFPRYDGGPAFLFEIPPADAPLGLEQRLFELQVRGFRPVMAHPERYAAFWPENKGEARLERLVESGVVTVVDLGAITGYHGARQQKAAKRLLERGLVHAVATDAHDENDVLQARDGIAWIRKKLGLEAVTRLCDDNPRRILAGQAPE